MHDEDVGMIKIPHYSDMDSVLSQAEKDILEQWQLQERENSLTSTAGRIVSREESVVFCAGNHFAFPGLSQTVKLTSFGHSTASEGVKAKWSHLLEALKGPKK